MIAILPAAGKGLRMRSVTSGPKELLEVGGHSVLSRVMGEAESAGISDIVVIASPDKPEIATAAGLARLVTQDRATGLAPAVILAGLRDALILLPDTIYMPASPAKRLVGAISRGYDVAIAVQPVAEEDVSRYGIVEWNPESGRISRILEKPAPQETASRWAIAGRLAVSARALLYVRDRVRQIGEEGAEIDLPPLLGEAFQNGQSGIAIPLEADERRFDCGSPAGYREACEAADAGL